MAWGYWTAHALTPSARSSRPRSLSPGPGPLAPMAPLAHTRESSLERERAAMVGKLQQPRTPSSSGTQHTGQGGSSGSSYEPRHHGRDIDWSDRPDRTKDRDRDRNTLPRVKMESELGGGGGGGGGGMVEQRHTLPRGRTECESHGWPEVGGLGGGGGGNKAASEGDWCPGCQTASCPVSNVSSCR